MFDPCSDHLFDIHDARQPLVQSQHIAPEGHLQIAKLVELIDDHFRDLVAFQLDDDAHTIFIGLIAQVGDAGDLSCC